MAGGVLSRDEVIFAYRLMLGRDPESEQRTASYVDHCDRSELFAAIISSEEMARRLYALDMRANPIGPVIYERETRATMRRLEHLAQLDLPVAGKTVADIGAGAGLMSSFFTDRDCQVHLVDASERLLSLARARAERQGEIGDRDNLTFQVADFDVTEPTQVEPRDVTVCYDTLWQARDARAFLANLAAVTREFLILETRLAFGRQEEQFISVDPDPRKLGGVTTPLMTTPTRAWLWHRLGESFPYVYVARRQPHLPEFPLDWRYSRGAQWGRMVFVASRVPLDRPGLATEMPDLFDA